MIAICREKSEARRALADAARRDVWRDGELVRQEEHTLRINLYFMNETLLLLERAGFTDLVVHAGHRDEAPTGNNDFIVFVARKP